MIAFKLESREVTLAHYNARKEKHGDQDVDAADLKLRVDLPMTELAMFAPDLAASLYRQDEKDVAGAPTILRFPRLEPIRWDEAVAGGEVIVHYGISGDGDMALANAQVDKFVLGPREGGSVAVEFRVQFHPTEEQAGKLSTSLLGGTIRTTVKPPQGGAEA